MKIADKHGLTLAMDRLTTGNSETREGFHTFEFTGGMDGLQSAANELRNAWNLTGAARSLVYVRPSDIDGAPYLGVESFYCMREDYQPTACEHCGKPLSGRSHQNRFCSIHCYGIHTGYIEANAGPDD